VPCSHDSSSVAGAIVSPVARLPKPSALPAVGRHVPAPARMAAPTRVAVPAGSTPFAWREEGCGPVFPWSLLAPDGGARYDCRLWLRGIRSAGRGMSLDTFLASLFDHGRIAVPAPDAEESAGELAAAAAILDRFEADWRLDFPGEAPAWSHAAALHGARIVYRAAQGAVYREIGEAALRAGLDLPLPDDPDDASVHYSADVTLRFLPDLVRMARGASGDDPLLGLLDGVARRFPLSSVGIPGVTPESIEPIVGHPGLLRLYVDRILAAADDARLADGRVADAARLALGDHDELCPAVSRSLPRGDRP